MLSKILSPGFVDELARSQLYMLGLVPIPVPPIPLPSHGCMHLPLQGLPSSATSVTQDGSTKARNVMIL